MLKIIKYLKPYTLMIAVSIMLLFVQAMSQLALPGYMSDIVNKGLQQGGIDSAVPEAVRQSRMDKLMLFMNDRQKRQVKNAYTLADTSSNNYNEMVKKYPAIKEQPVYVLKDPEAENEEWLGLLMGKALMAAAGLEKVQAGEFEGNMQIDEMSIPEGADLFELFKKMPVEQRKRITDAMNQKFIAMGESMIVQSASLAIKAEYEALGMDTAKIQSRYIVTTGIIMLLISLLAGACTVLVGYFSSKTGAGLARDLRRKLFARVESFSNTEFDRFSTASLITRTTNDITQVQMLIIIMLRMVFLAPLMGIGGIIMALNKSVSMAWIIVLAVVILLGLIITVFSVAMPKFRRMQKLVDRLNLVMRENLLGMMVIRAFNTRKFEEQRFDKANTDLADTTLFINRVMVVMFPAMMFIMNGVMLLIVWTGAHQIANSSMQVGDMMAFMQYTMQIIFSFLMLSMMFIMIPRASISAQRIEEVITTEPDIKDPDNPVHFTGDSKGVVEFRNVSFRFAGAEERVLKDISFTAIPGKTTAIIGPTGSGKSTLVNLILRFYDVTDGSILMDGIDVRNLLQHELRERIGYVPQKSSLFSGTIGSNLRYADEGAPDERIRRCAEISQVMDFINDSKKGLETQISQGGANVSGGQKQRLSIARALVKNPPVYIFDDSFSAVDFKTDAALRKALKDRTSQSTLIIVAQRISTIMNAEQIIVLDKGRITGKGTHHELLESCSVYREIALSQLSKEELA